MSTTPQSEPALQPESSSGVPGAPPGPEPRGLIVLDKPQGITSRKALNVVERRLGVGPLGHCGSLDPLATGVLGITTYLAFSALERRLLHWHPSQRIEAL